jgi:signal transduction histidine kinase
MESSLQYLATVVAMMVSSSTLRLPLQPKRSFPTLSLRTSRYARVFPCSPVTRRVPWSRRDRVLKHVADGRLDKYGTPVMTLRASLKASTTSCRREPRRPSRCRSLALTDKSRLPWSLVGLTPSTPTLPAPCSLWRPSQGVYSQAVSHEVVGVNHVSHRGVDRTKLTSAVMKERLHQAERAQLNFAAAASHELRTPLHQINAAASLLRATLQNGFLTPKSSPSLGLSPPKQPLVESPLPLPPLAQPPLDKPSDETPKTSKDETIKVVQPPASAPGGSTTSGLPLKRSKDGLERPSLRHLPSDDKADALAQLEIIESNGMALGTILENIIDTLDIGRLTSRLETKLVPGLLDPARAQSLQQTPIQTPGEAQTARTGGDGKKGAGAKEAEERLVTATFDEVLEKVVMDCIALEERSRKIHGSTVGGAKGLEDVEVVLEVLPRGRGGWKMAQDPGPLSRYV